MLFFSFQRFYELVDFLLRHVLHHYNVGKLAAEVFVVALGEVVGSDDVGRWAAEENGVAALVDPCGPSDFVKLLR